MFMVGLVFVVESWCEPVQRSRRRDTMTPIRWCRLYLDFDQFHVVNHLSIYLFALLISAYSRTSCVTAMLYSLQLPAATVTFTVTSVSQF